MYKNETMRQICQALSNYWGALLTDLFGLDEVVENNSEPTIIGGLGSGLTVREYAGKVRLPLNVSLVSCSAAARRFA